MSNARKLLVPRILIALGLVMAQNGVAQLVMYDDFADGDIGINTTNGFNISKCNGGPGVEGATSGDLLLDGMGSDWSKWCLQRFDREPISRASDWSFRANATLGSGLLAVGLQSLEHASIWITDGSSTPAGTLTAGTGRDVNRAAVGYEVKGERLSIQMDAFGDTIKASLWREGDANSHVEVSHSFPNPTLQIPAFGIRGNSMIAGVASTIHEMWISNSPIPKSFLRGDFNADTHFDMTDINQLTEAMQTGDSRFDVNGDNEVNNDDRVVWVHDIKNTWFGDANLDGEFNSTDFVDVFQVGKYETGQAAGWQEGDWNGDGFFSSGDFVTAFEDGGFELGPRAVVQSVPEPSSILMMLMGLIVFTRFRSRLGA